MRTQRMRLVRIAIPQVFGGARRDRTADPLLAKQVLSQLSYGPFESEQRYKRKEQRKATFLFNLFSFL